MESIQLLTNFSVVGVEYAFEDVTDESFIHSFEFDLEINNFVMALHKNCAKLAPVLVNIYRSRYLYRYYFRY